MLWTWMVLFATLLRATPHITVSTGTSVGGGTVRPGAAVKLFVDVTPDAKIRLYAPGAKDYLPVALQLSPLPAAVRAGKQTYPASQDWYFAPLKEHVPVYQTSFRLTQDIVIAASAKRGQSLTIQGVFKYQACDDTICYTPVSTPVSWTVSVQ